MSNRYTVTEEDLNAVSVSSTHTTKIDLDAAQKKAVRTVKEFTNVSEENAISLLMDFKFDVESAVNHIVNLTESGNLKKELWRDTKDNQVKKSDQRGKGQRGRGRGKGPYGNQRDRNQNDKRPAAKAKSKKVTGYAEYEAPAVSSFNKNVIEKSSVASWDGNLNWARQPKPEPPKPVEPVLPQKATPASEPENKNDMVQLPDPSLQPKVERAVSTVTLPGVGVNTEESLRQLNLQFGKWHSSQSQNADIGSLSQHSEVISTRSPPLQLNTVSPQPVIPVTTETQTEPASVQESIGTATQPIGQPLHSSTQDPTLQSQLGNRFALPGLNQTAQTAQQVPQWPQMWGQTTPIANPGMIYNYSQLMQAQAAAVAQQQIGANGQQDDKLRRETDDKWSARHGAEAQPEDSYAQDYYSAYQQQIQQTQANQPAFFIPPQSAYAQYYANMYGAQGAYGYPGYPAPSYHPGNVPAANQDQIPEEQKQEEKDSFSVGNWGHSSLRNETNPAPSFQGQTGYQQNLNDWHQG